MKADGVDVVQVVSSFPPVVGGVERATAALCSALADGGVRVAVLTRRHPHLPRREERDGYRIHRLGAGHPGKLGSLTYGIQALRWLASARRELGVVHVQNPDTPLLVGILARVLGRLPLVVTIHGEAKIQRMSRSYPGRMRLGLARRAADRFTALTGDVADALRRVGVPAERIASIPNGVDTGRMRPPAREERAEARSELGIAGDRRVATFVGRLAPSKGIDVLLEAWAARGENDRRELLLVGDGAERAALRERAEALGLGEGSVRFVGEVDDVRPYLWATDVFVLPSREEGLSLALLEAMAAGACVIVTDLPGHRDVVTDGETGYRVPVGDVGALREALDRSFASSELRSAMGDGARRWVLEHASLARTSEAHTELYAGLRRRGSDRPARAPVS